MLGHIVSERGIEVDPEKMRAILDMPTLRREREIRGFLDRLQYISHFIARLIDLLRSYLDVFSWSYEDMLGLDPLYSLA